MIEAVTALRRYRDEVGAKPGAQRARRTSPPRATTPAATTWPGSRASSGWTTPRRRRRARHRADPRRRRAGAALGGLRRRRGGARASRRRRRTFAARSSAPSSKLANEQFVAKAPRRGGGRGAPQARGVPRGAASRLEGRVTFRQAEEYLLGAGAVRHALRARPHAPADDRARAAAAALRLDPRGGLERQVLDRALLRGDPRAPRAAHRAATRRRTCARSASASRWGRSRSRRPTSPRRSRAPRRRPSW